MRPLIIQEKFMLLLNKSFLSVTTTEGIEKLPKYNGNFDFEIVFAFVLDRLIL